MPSPLPRASQRLQGERCVGGAGQGRAPSAPGWVVSAEAELCPRSSSECRLWFQDGLSLTASSGRILSPLPCL